MRKEAPGEPGDPRARPRRRQGLLPAREPGPLPRAPASSASSRASTGRATSPRTCSATSARSPPSSSSCRATRRLEQGDVVGQSGIEYEYDRFLRGKPGASRFQVDALGRPTGQLASEPARAGDNVRLTIDSDLQALGEGALGSFGLPGAFVAMNVDNGEMLAMGSAPTFDPSIFTRPITQQPVRGAGLAQERRAARQPRDPGPLPDRLGLQADHRRSAALEEGLIEPGDDRQRHRRAQDRHRSPSRTPTTRSSARST